MLSQPSFLDPVVEFVQIESECQQKVFRPYPIHSSPQKTGMAHILLQDSKYAFCLDRSVDPQQDPFFGLDVCPASGTVFIESAGY